MSEAIKQETVPGHDYAYNTPLEDLDVSNPHLWPSEEMWPIFERLRDEDPLHYCKDGWTSEGRTEMDEPIGPYWSVTRYEDIMAVDTDHKRFLPSRQLFCPIRRLILNCRCLLPWISPSMMCSVKQWRRSSHR